MEVLKGNFVNQIKIIVKNSTIRFLMIGKSYKLKINKVMLLEKHLRLVLKIIK